MATAFPTLDLKPLPGSLPDIAAWRAAIAALPADDRAALAPLFSPSAIRAARLTERDGLLLRMAIGLSGDAEAVARAVHAELSRYAAAAWRFSRDRPEPHDRRHALAHQVLRIEGGRVLSVRSLRRTFGFVAVAKKTVGNGHGDPASPGQLEGKNA